MVTMVPDRWTARRSGASLANPRRRGARALPRLIIRELFTPRLRFRWHTSLHTDLADFYCAFGTVFLRSCYHQILGPRRHFPKFTNCRCRHSDVFFRLNPHCTWQATKSYVERGNASGLKLHKGSLRHYSSGFWNRARDFFTSNRQGSLAQVQPAEEGPRRATTRPPGPALPAGLQRGAKKPSGERH